MIDQWWESKDYTQVQLLNGIIPEINYIDELPQGMFPIVFNIVYQYQWKEPVLTAKLKCPTYQCGYFRGLYHNNFKLIACRGKESILPQNQKMRSELVSYIYLSYWNG